MPTVVTSIIDPTGSGDYTTLSAWQTAKAGDLVTADQQQIAEVRGGGDVGGLTISGWTTDATRNVIIRAASGHHHLGLWDNDKAKIDGNGNNIIINQDIDLEIRGLQIRNTATASNSFCVRTQAPEGADNIVLRDCLLRGSETGASFTYGIWATGPIRVYNCVTWGYARGFFASSLTTNDIIYLSHCTFIGEDRGIWISDADGTKTVNNTYAHGPTAAWTLTGSATSSKVATSDTSGPDATLHSIAHDTSTFINVTSGSEDYHLASGSDLIGAGAQDANVPEDYEEGTRDTSGPDIGADEFGVSGLAVVSGGSAVQDHPVRRIARLHTHGGFFF